MQKLDIVDGPYSATCNSQPLTFIDSDFVGADNTQATEFNYELTFPNDLNNFNSQQLASQLDTASQMTTTNGFDDQANQVVKDLNALNFEDDEEEMYNVIDLPKHAW